MIFEESPEETPGTQKAVAQAGLPTLIGCEEDMARAEAVRTEVLIQADTLLSQIRSEETLTENAPTAAAAAQPQDHSHDQIRIAQAALNRLRHRNEAQWWLQNGSRGAEVLLQESMASESA